MDFNNNNNNNMDVADAYSPAMSDFSDMDDDELDLYLANCGRLSSLPTPPPPSHHRITVPAFASPPALQTPPPEPQVARHFSELQGT
ncbi:hypothetical protein P280DRAFT_474544 [Massarina eburnea CBS 473.64]|uniref:Uncharacterized protein n=1 Tax=Massarina eburnea CBS 473.64 TaxID=1395130 RepID=A0A6A6RKM7_9PLEO|nr:hypothetical protein P280DRAFT_474544 [Massarina eburnea CBS 473.64]